MLGKTPETAAQELVQRVTMLMAPQAYEDNSGEVTVMETAHSWIFLTRRFAYKLKKAESNGSIGPDSLAERRRQCNEDVRLNRRLAPDVYIGAVPLTRAPNGLLSADGNGAPVDWLVKMRRLPADRMLDRAICADSPSARELRFVTGLLGRFFRAAVPVAMPPMEYRRRLADSITASRRALMVPAARHGVRTIELVTAALRKFMMGHPVVFDKRVRRGCIREGHGDLRAANVFLGPKAAVIGCLDRDRDMRIMDFADELSLPAIECEALGKPQPGRTILEACCDRLGDVPEPELIDFYKARHALMRAGAAIWNGDECIAGGNRRKQIGPETWLALAARYARQIG